VYLHDTIEKEPAGLLLLLLGLGVLSALCAGIVEGLAQPLLDRVAEPGSFFHTVLLAFVVVATVEETAKYVFLKKWTWEHPAFDYRYDGIVYAVFVSLGFAAYENIQYVLHYGLSVALPRALLAVPGHMAFAVFMGVFYGRAKRCERDGYEVAAGMSRGIGLVLAIFFHGFYDCCAMLGTSSATIVFLIFVAVMYVWVYRLLKHESDADSLV
jgi:RsiW-degrading membrane proteinase PrsW (M82 family)